MNPPVAPKRARNSPIKSDGGSSSQYTKSIVADCRFSRPCSYERNCNLTLHPLLCLIYIVSSNPCTPRLLIAPSTSMKSGWIHPSLYPRASVPIILLCNESRTVLLSVPITHAFISSSPFAAFFLGLTTWPVHQSG